MPIPDLVLGEKRMSFGERSYIMGILNATPDSFSDGGRFTSLQQAIDAGLHMHAAGADIIDIGGESTRPGAEPVVSSEEIDRVCPVIQGLYAAGLRCLSVDTRKADVAEAAIRAGATMVNDVSAGVFDEQMFGIVAKHRVAYVLMHSRDVPARMQLGEIHYDNVVADICSALQHRVSLARQSGIQTAQMLLDPGIGFGKKLNDNLALTKGVGCLRELGHAVVYGPSRKSFIGQLLDGLAPLERLEGTLAACVVAAAYGADIFRVHDVEQARRALTVADALVRR